MKVAVPWSLSHYIPLNGFHPLYRALFDHAPAEVQLNAWDNVKLHRHFETDREDLQATLSATAEKKRPALESANTATEKAYGDYFGASNRVLTETLIGDIEFHHTAPFPSLKRPFVFHCESFAPVFLPFAQQGSGGFDRHEELRAYYGSILANPLCLGIYSHIPETLESLSLFFGDEVIYRKLLGSRIGLSHMSIDVGQRRRNRNLGRPRFLFINSADQNPANFFHRGGHIGLRFWKEFVSAGRSGQLILRCARPKDEIMAQHGVDTSFVRTESGRSILWVEDFLANHEINALMADADFFLLPSASLHSVSILNAMTVGTIPVVTDTVGTSTYVADGEDAIVLKGVRNEIWHRDPNTGILVDRYRRTPALDKALVSQLTERIFELLDSPDAYDRISRRAAEKVQKQFSGEAFSADFWHATIRAYEGSKLTRTGAAPSELSRSLSDCTLAPSDWSRVFESVTQPVRRLNTGQSSVWELGGAVVHVSGNPAIELRHWSVLARHLDHDAPDITFATNLVELDGKFLSRAGVFQQPHQGRFRRQVSKLLMPYPGLHSLAARAYMVAREGRRLFGMWWRSVLVSIGKPGIELDIELIAENVAGYNVIRYFHKYYGIPRGEGEFQPKRIARRAYSSIFSAYSLDAVLRKINAKAPQRAYRVAARARGRSRTPPSIEPSIEPGIERPSLSQKKSNR